MDGTSLKIIVENPKVSAITIDRKATRIYWANDQISIESSDYDGNNRQIVTPISMSIISLTKIENQLFWTRTSNWSDCPCTNVLWTCILNRRTCNDVKSLILPFDGPKFLKTSYDQHRHSVKNPCNEDNGGCEHLCLMTSKNSHDCACNVGSILNSDGKTCTNSSKLLLYAQGDFIRAKFIGLERNESFTSAIVPTKFHVSKMTKKTSIHFDYDMLNGNFFFSDDSSINKINVFNDEEQTQVLNVSDNYAIKDVVYDWTKDCLFYVKQSQDSLYNHSIMMFSLKPEVKLQKIIISSKFKKENYIDCPHNLALQANHEYLFFADYNGVNDNLRRISTNGKGLILWKPFYSNIQLIFLTIDHERLYWLTSFNTSMIKSANLEGSEEDNIQVSRVTNLLYAAVNDWLYVGNFSEIWAVKRDTGSDPRKLVKKKFQKTGAQEFIHGLKIYSPAARSVT